MAQTYHLMTKLVKSQTAIYVKLFFYFLNSPKEISTRILRLQENVFQFAKHILALGIIIYGPLSLGAGRALASRTSNHSLCGPGKGASSCRRISQALSGRVRSWVPGMFATLYHTFPSAPALSIPFLIFHSRAPNR